MVKKLFPVINILLITVAVYLGVSAFYRIATAKVDKIDLYKPVRKQPASPKDEISHPLSYYQTIIDRNLFNTKTGIEKKTDQVDIEALEQTDLNLKLWGTVTGDKKKAYAVIEETKENRQDLYRVGDTVQGATVKLILREKVVLSVKGKDEVLEIEEMLDEEKFVKSSKSSKPSRPPRSQNITLKRSQIDTAVKDINSLMNQVKMSPNFENGKPAGLVLKSIKPNSIFRKMGLRSGDVIKGVDGKDIQSVDDALKLYESLNSSSSLQLQLKRRGELKNINYNIR
ncbi:MAG: type II secretion system protein GspC [Deltaproteobacteria bacterium]|nr:type II secretion system protein GspC [Deltaproteobacteria bacterium]MBW2100869.1 type II secretion system protein GspC [Deltaproteobacteria bacterium]